ncbi:MAG: MarR family transcriptional regulator [Pseudomonadota bacterium]
MAIYCNMLAYASDAAYISTMTEICTTNALRLLQAADELKARLAGEFSSVHGLSVNEFFLLMHLEKASLNRLSRVELAKRMHVSASTVTRMAAPMEKLGLLGRQVDERDARLAFVVLTEAGKTKLDETLATFAKQAGYAFQNRWDEDELEQFSQLLHRLVAGSVASLT